MPYLLAGNYSRNFIFCNLIFIIYLLLFELIESHYFNRNYTNYYLNLTYSKRYDGFLLNRSLPLLSVIHFIFILYFLLHEMLF